MRRTVVFADNFSTRYSNWGYYETYCGFKDLMRRVVVLGDKADIRRYQKSI
jgi:hypothetical protein